MARPGRAGRAISLRTVAWEWTRIGIIGFGGPPAHIALLRRRFVEGHRWIGATDFEDAVAATALLPGPASTQLAIWCAWKMRRASGALIGGIGFIAPGLVVILVLARLLLAPRLPTWAEGAVSGAGAAVPAVALRAAGDLVPASWRRIGGDRADHGRFVAYAAAGALVAAMAGEWLAIALLACGLLEIGVRRRDQPPPVRSAGVFPLVGRLAAAGGPWALVWTAFKVGALSYGGGFVIVPLMQHDAVSTGHWMTAATFLVAVALGQVTPGPVVLTVAVVGYAAGGVPDALLATAVAFAPSFVFVMAGASHFDKVRADPRLQAFLAGAGPATIGAIAGAAVPLALALHHLWQLGVLGPAAAALLAARRGPVVVILVAAALGVVAALAGAPVGR